MVEHKTRFQHRPLGNSYGPPTHHTNNCTTQKPSSYGPTYITKVGKHPTSSHKGACSTASPRRQTTQKADELRNTRTLTQRHGNAITPETSDPGDSNIDRRTVREHANLAQLSPISLPDRLSTTEHDYTDTSTHLPTPENSLPTFTARIKSGIHLARPITTRTAVAHKIRPQIYTATFFKRPPPTQQRIRPPETGVTTY